MADTEDRDWQRLDKWLWCARFMRQRADCARLVAGGLIRVNRVATDKPHARLRVGDVLTLPLGARVLVLEVLRLAARREGAAEARLLYRTLGGGCEGQADGAYPPPGTDPAPWSARQATDDTPPGAPDDLRGHG